MNDGYEEILVKRQPRAVDTVLKILVIAAAVIPVIFGVVFAFLPAIAIGIVLGFVGYYLLLPQLDVEFEYLYVGGDIDIDKIMSKRKRKKVASYDKEAIRMSGRGLPYTEARRNQPSSRWSLPRRSPRT